MGGRHDDLHDAPVPAGSEAGIQGRAEPRRERQSPRNKAGDVVFESASQKPNSCLSYFEGLQGDNAADGYFCSQKTRAGHVCRQLCSVKVLRQIYTAVTQAYTSCVPLTFPKHDTPIAFLEHIQKIQYLRKRGSGGQLTFAIFFVSCKDISLKGILSK